MRRILLVGLIATTALLLITGWWLGSQFFSSYAIKDRIDGLQDSTTIHRSTEGIRLIRTASTTDAVRALGYVHGRDRGWTAVLWRQTALGKLSEWFGTDVISVDRHARKLGLARHARQAFRRLPPPAKAYVRAYSKGLNRALQTETVREGDHFTLLGIQPSEWKPWHTLLTQRLLAWIATPTLSPSKEAPNPVRTFFKRDRLLRRWLHLHGWERSVAWSVRSSNDTDTSAPMLFQRHVLGASAAPVIQEVMWDRPGDATLTWATFPGTLLFPTGTRRKTAWASLLRSQVRLDTVTFESTELRHWYERLEPEGGDEQLLRVDRIGNTLPIYTATVDQARGNVNAVPDTVAADSVRKTTNRAWVVEWPGLSETSDIAAWIERGLPSSPDSGSTGFSLFQGDGLQITADGKWNVLGTPERVERTNQTILVGQSIWAREQSRLLSQRAQSGPRASVGSWSASDSSAWASGLFPHLRSTLSEYAPKSEPLQNATTYLQNWDFNYTPQSIGAVIFDQWMREYRAELEHVPTLRDTAAYFAGYRQKRALARALDSLVHRLGPDVRRWRWDRVVSDRRYFPVWSADSLVNASLGDLQSTRYAPLTRTGRGHPSALSGGPSLVDSVTVAPSPDQWDAWMRPGSHMTVRRAHFEPNELFARSRIQRDSVPTHHLTQEVGNGKPILLLPDVSE